MKRFLCRMRVCLICTTWRSLLLANPSLVKPFALLLFFFILSSVWTAAATLCWGKMNNLIQTTIQLKTSMNKNVALNLPRFSTKEGAESHGNHTQDAICKTWIPAPFLHRGALNVQYFFFGSHVLRRLKKLPQASSLIWKGGHAQLEHQLCSDRQCLQKVELQACQPRRLWECKCMVCCMKLVSASFQCPGVSPTVDLYKCIIHLLG